MGAHTPAVRHPQAPDRAVVCLQSRGLVIIPDERIRLALGQDPGTSLKSR